MKRRPLSRPKSRRIFKKTAMHINSMNTAPKPMRGGIRM